MDGKFFTVELSPKFVTAQKAIGENRDALTELFDEDEDKSNDDSAPWFDD